MRGVCLVVGLVARRRRRALGRPRCLWERGLCCCSGRWKGRQSNLSGTIGEEGVRQCGFLEGSRNVDVVGLPSSRTVGMASKNDGFLDRLD